MPSGSSTNRWFSSFPPWSAVNRTRSSSGNVETAKCAWSLENVSCVGSPPPNGTEYTLNTPEASE